LTDKKLHIICLDVPFPANYGGAIDMFYRIKALYKLGYDLTIHVYEYGRGKQKELRKYGKVIYYPRKKSILQLFSDRPLIVQSRRSKELLKNLRIDSAPILFEGIHTTWPLEFEDIQNRITIVRMHNIEHDYYKGLAKNSSFFKGLYFKEESRKLKKYEKMLAKASAVLAIKESDSTHLKKINPNTVVLPASFPEIEGKYQAVKPFALFHGNLSVAENEKAALWLIKILEPISDPNFPLVLAGKNPSKRLKTICNKLNITLYVNPYDHQLDELIQEAQIHVLHTSVSSGIKLKLLSCLYSSGHVLVNREMLTGTDLDEFCVVADDPKDYKMHFLGLKNKVLTKEEFERRKNYIDQHFNNERNCSIITKILDEKNTF